MNRGDKHSMCAWLIEHVQSFVLLDRRVREEIAEAALKWHLSFRGGDDELGRDPEADPDFVPGPNDVKVPETKALSKEESLKDFAERNPEAAAWVKQTADELRAKKVGRPAKRTPDERKAYRAELMREKRARERRGE